MTAQTYFDFIQGRRSIGKLETPQPSRDEIARALTVAMSAPDHKQLTPWRFVVMDTPEARDKLGAALLTAGLEDAKQQGETLDEIARHKLINMPKRAPVLIACISDYKPHVKVPEFEQLLSMGAAVQNLLLALHALGYQSIWRSGPLMNHAALRTLFKAQGSNLICGFVYVGSSDVVMPERTGLALDNYVTYL